jgi:hypothetical protein
MKERVKRCTIYFLDLLGHKYCKDNSLLEAYLLAEIPDVTIIDIRCCFMEMAQDDVLFDEEGVYFLSHPEPVGRGQEYFRLNDKVHILFTLIGETYHD